MGEALRSVIQFLPHDARPSMVEEEDETDHRPSEALLDHLPDEVDDDVLRSVALEGNAERKSDQVEEKAQDASEPDPFGNERFPDAQVFKGKSEHEGDHEVDDPAKGEKKGERIGDIQKVVQKDPVPKDRSAEHS